MSVELYKKYRPRRFVDIAGQKEAVTVLKEMVASRRVPHTLLFKGPSGCGKTTLARILQTKLECAKHDFFEENCAEARGIDDIRRIQGLMPRKPMDGKCRIWLLDEVHKLTNDSQNCLLKTLEDTPDWVYFFLCTTDPQKLIPTIVTRCTVLSLSPLSYQELKQEVNRILEKEKLSLDSDVMEVLIESAEGSARQCIVNLNKIIGLQTKEEQIEAISKASLKHAAIEIVQILMGKDTNWKPMKPTWKRMTAVLNDMKGEDVEGLRHMVLTAASNALLRNGDPNDNARAMQIIDTFRDHLFDSKWPGFVGNCYFLIQGK